MRLGQEKYEFLRKTLTIAQSTTPVGLSLPKQSKV